MCYNRCCLLQQLIFNLKQCKTIFIGRLLKKKIISLSNLLMSSFLGFNGNYLHAIVKLNLYFVIVIFLKTLIFDIWKIYICVTHYAKWDASKKRCFLLHIWIEHIQSLDVTYNHIISRDSNLNVGNANSMVFENNCFKLHGRYWLWFSHCQNKHIQWLTHGSFVYSIWSNLTPNLSNLSPVFTEIFQRIYSIQDGGHTVGNPKKIPILPVRWTFNLWKFHICKLNDKIVCRL